MSPRNGVAFVGGVGVIGSRVSVLLNESRPL